MSSLFPLSILQIDVAHQKTSRPYYLKKIRYCSEQISTIEIKITRRHSFAKMQTLGCGKLSLQRFCFGRSTLKMHSESRGHEYLQNISDMDQVISTRIN